jgi:hypothetical protein
MRSTLPVVRSGVCAVTACERSAACGPARLILGLAMRSAALCPVATLLPLPTIIASVSCTISALLARPMSLMPCAVVITPFMALWPHKSCLAETHGMFAPDRTDLLRARLPSHTATLPCHVKTGQVEFDLPLFLLCRHGRRPVPLLTARRDQLKSSLRVHVLASVCIGNWPHPAWFGARLSSNLELCPATMLLKPNPAITEGTSHRTILSQIGHTT